MTAFTDADRRRYFLLKEELRQKLQRNLPSSEAVFHCARIFVEIRDSGLYGIEDFGDTEAWAKEIYGLTRHQADKYFRVGDRLAAAEVAGKTQGLEAMDQVALAPPELRPPLWELAETQRLSSGALCAGRLQAERHVRRGDLPRALRVLAFYALKQARKEAQEPAERKARPRPTLLERIERLFDQAEAALEALLDQEAPPRAGIEALGERIDRLVALRASLRERAAGTSGQEAAAQQPAAPPGPMAEFRPLIAALQTVLSQEQQLDLGEDLIQVVHGETPAAALREWLDVVEESGQAPLPEGLRRRWLRALTQPGREDRRLFALRFAAAAGLPGLDLKLRMLKFHPLPEPLQMEAARLLGSGAAAVR